MKAWNNAELKELNINETANGFIDCEVETCLLFNDNLKKPVTPELPDVETQLS